MRGPPAATWRPPWSWGWRGRLLILAQAGLLAHALAAAARGSAAVTALWGTLLALLGVVAVRAAVTYGGEVAALRAAADVKSQLRRALAARALRLGPAWLGGQRAGEITTLATRGLDGLDTYFARYLPQLVLAVAVPVAVLVRVALADWISAVVIAVTLPLIPVFAVLVGWHTKAKTQRQWRLLATLAGHFLDVVEGLPTLKVFGRAKAQEQVIGKVTGEHRAATMSALRVAFLSALVLELSAAIATALVAVEVGLRLLAGHLGYQTALLVLLLTPEAYLPLRAVGAQFHASMEGAAAADRVLEILETPHPGGPQAQAAVPGREDTPSPRPVGPGRPVADPGWPVAGPPEPIDLRADEIRLDGVTVAYPGGRTPRWTEVSLTIRPGERIVLTGPSGAGKSSLLALLLRFIQPAAGTIQAGGADLATLGADPWRAQIAWVPQQPHLFAGSCRGQHRAGPARREPRRRSRGPPGWPGRRSSSRPCRAAMTRALGERALRLSAGQRQRIALARAFLRDAPLLLLDEPTAHLDPAAPARSRRSWTRFWPTAPSSWSRIRPGWAAGGGRVISLERGRLVAGRSAAVPRRCP